MTDPHPVVAAGAIAVGLVADPAVASRWSEPSALDGYRVGGLAAHLVRALETIRTYVEADGPDEGARTEDAAGYFATVLGDHDPHASEFHSAVRSRAEGRVATGHAAVVADASTALRWLEDATLPADRPVSVASGIAVRLGDYLDTRLVELVVHSDDLAASVGLPGPTFPDDATRTVARVLAELVLRRQPPGRVAGALSRPDRHPMTGAFDRVAGSPSGAGPTG